MGSASSSERSTNCLSPALPARDTNECDCVRSARQCESFVCSWRQRHSRGLRQWNMARPATLHIEPNGGASTCTRRSSISILPHLRLCRSRSSTSRQLAWTVHVSKLRSSNSSCGLLPDLSASRCGRRPNLSKPVSPKLCIWTASAAEASPGHRCSAANPVKSVSSND